MQTYPKGWRNIPSSHERIPYLFRICLDILSKLRTPESTLFGIVSQPKDFSGNGAFPQGGAETGLCCVRPESAL